tara:strand:+ start:463 stop:1863 length:1401 start_codon:yes stop_codon:yes gene_type:complete
MAKKIRQFNIDTSNIHTKGETRQFNIIGDAGAGFFLFVKNQDGNYYNFVKNKFQATGEPSLRGEITENGYLGNIIFPSLAGGGAAGEVYTVFLITDISLDSIHEEYNEVRRADGSIDINKSTGSDSNMLKRVIYQIGRSTLTIDSLNVSGGSGFTGMSDTTDTIVTEMFGTSHKVPFSISVTAQNGRAFRLKRQPVPSDFAAKIDGGTVGTYVKTKLAGEGTNSRFQWEFSDVSKITNGMYVTGANVTANTVVSDGVDKIISSEGTEEEIEREKTFEKGVIRTGPIAISVDNTSKVETTSFGGNITFNQGQVDALAGDTDVDFYGYGMQKISDMTKWHIDISDLKAELTPVTTRVSGAVSNSTSVPVVSGHGIMDGNISKVTSANMNRANASTTVTTIGSYVVGSAATATLTLSSAQTLDDAEELTFTNAGLTVTITGNIDVKQAGDDATIYLDVSKMIDATVETA